MEHFEVLGVEAERDGDKIIGRCTGPLADVVNPFFQAAITRMARYLMPVRTSHMMSMRIIRAFLMQHKLLDQQSVL